jgi:hypothetical protein
MKLTRSVALAAALLWSSPLWAYVRTANSSGAAVKWANGCIGLVAHPSSPPAPLTSAAITAAVKGAAAAWSRPFFTCTTLQMSVTTESDDGSTGRDNLNQVVFRPKRWCRDSGGQCYDPAALAITTITVNSTGAILDADIEVNAVNYKWDDLTAKNPANGTMDLQSALTHEVGHLVGLDHNCYVTGADRHPLDENGKVVPDCVGAPPAVKEAIMFPSIVGAKPVRRRLSADEASFVCKVYPLKASAQPPVCGALADGGAPDGRRGDAGADAEDPPGCAYGGRPGGSALALLALSALALAARRRACPSRR